ncbi:Glutaredoxin-C13 [Salvia divinorum]|uniref:Glutaredoxin-C13 n=1 Tax=Salvia divinorum TaxID=28513 RepID=A0ABD1H1C1_SALDI
MEKIVKLASENGILIFSKSTCCLCYAVQILFKELRVQPRIIEIDTLPDGVEIEKALKRLGSGGSLPAVFIGGKLVGSTKEVMSLHLSGNLVQLLRQHAV